MRSILIVWVISLLLSLPNLVYSQSLREFFSGSSERNSEFIKAIKRARSYLIRTQKKDGSWFVKSRSKPIQKFFDNGDPHGKDQFISISATSWATAALAKSRIINTQ